MVILWLLVYFNCICLSSNKTNALHLQLRCGKFCRSCRNSYLFYAWIIMHKSCLIFRIKPKFKYSLAHNAYFPTYFPNSNPGHPARKLNSLRFLFQTLGWQEDKSLVKSFASTLKYTTIGRIIRASSILLHAILNLYNAFNPSRTSQMGLKTCYSSGFWLDLIVAIDLRRFLLGK